MMKKLVYWVWNRTGCAGDGTLAATGCITRRKHSGNCYAAGAAKMFFFKLQRDEWQLKLKSIIPHN